MVGDPKGCRGRAESPRLRRCTPASPKGNPCWGSDAPTTARLVGCRPEGGSTFFRSERKYQRKHAARRLQRRPTSLCAVGFGLREPFGLSSTSARCAHPPGKSPLLPIFERGSSQCRAQWSWTAFTCSWSALVLTLFLFQKGQGFFPPLPIAARLPRRWR